jgi:hypothetical protein
VTVRHYVFIIRCAATVLTAAEYIFANTRNNAVSAANAEVALCVNTKKDVPNVENAMDLHSASTTSGAVSAVNVGKDHSVNTTRGVTNVKIATDRLFASTRRGETVAQIALVI